jgi:hypothetical protein
MEGEHLAGSEGLVGEDDLEVVAIGMGDEEIELHGVFVLLFDPSANEEETMANIPSLRFPLRLKVGASRLDLTPPSTRFNASFEFYEALEGDADRMIIVGTRQGQTRLSDYDGNCSRDGVDRAVGQVCRSQRARWSPAD